MSETPIGLIGAGLLGTALAERMLSSGYRVLGFDPAAEQLERLRALAGAAAKSAADVAAHCDQVVLCLPNSDVVTAVVAEMEAAIRPGALILDATTGDPEATVELAARLAARDIGYVDATIAGSSEQVRRGGVAVIICGGAADDFRRAEAALATWSETRFHVGPAGSGARLKLIVNLVLGLNRAVLAEGLSLAAACGIDAAKALDVLKATPAYSTVMDTKGQRMIARDYQPQARLAQHHKDVRLIRELARRHGALVPLSELHEELLARAIELGYGEADNSAIIEAFRAPSLPLPPDSRPLTPDSRLP
jgi:3-hydroxyisobutyrate dehydrogenase-like beta-hydroxyacid dehydrogenase